MYKRLAKGFLLGLASLILLLTVLIYFVLGTQTGSHYLVNKLSEYLPDQLSFSRYKGTLLDQFEFHGLKLDSPAFSLHSEQVTVDWSPSDLLRGTARINSVTFKNAEVAKSPKQTKCQFGQVRGVLTKKVFCFTLV